MYIHIYIYVYGAGHLEPDHFSRNRGYGGLELISYFRALSISLPEIAELDLALLTVLTAMRKKKEKKKKRKSGIVLV